MTITSPKANLLLSAFCAAASALVYGSCLVRITRHFDGVDLTITLLFGACLIADLLWTRREVRRLVAGKIANKAATQFLWSCICFCILSFGLGAALSGLNWSSPELVQKLNLALWGALTGIAIYPLWRDTKRLAGAAEPSQTQ